MEVEVENHGAKQPDQLTDSFLFRFTIQKTQKDLWDAIDDIMEVKLVPQMQTSPRQGDVEKDSWKFGRMMCQNIDREQEYGSR